MLVPPVGPGRVADAAAQDSAAAPARTCEPAAPAAPRAALAAVPGPVMIGTREGVQASIEVLGEQECLRVHDASGRLLFEHRAGVTVLCVPAGDLELRVAAGAVRVAARDGIEMAVPGTARAARLALGPAGLEVEGASLRTRVAISTLHADEVRIDAGAFDLAARRAHQVFGVLELKAGRILERARDVYRDVEQHLQVRAGRIRTVASETYHLMARRTLLKSREDTKVKAEKIYLG